MTDSEASSIFDPVEIGATMREAREALKRDITEVAEELRIRISYLESIEAGRMEELPGPAYATGFLRAYGDYLGLDGSKIVNLFKAAGGVAEPHTSLSMPSPVEEGRLPTGSVLLVAGVLALFTYGGWYYMSSGDAVGPDRDTGISELLAEGPGDPAAEETGTDAVADAESAAEKPATEHAEATGKAADDEARPKSVEKVAKPVRKIAKKVAAKPPPVAGPSPIRRGNRDASALEEAVDTGQRLAARVVAPPPPAPNRRPSAPAPRATTRAPAPIVAPTVTPTVAPSAAQNAARGRSAVTPALPAGPITIVVRMRGDGWVEVRKGQESPVLSRLMRSGETFEVPKGGGYRMATGNAGAVEITVDGRTAPSLGGPGEVRRDVVLDAATLLTGSTSPR